MFSSTVPCPGLLAGWLMHAAPPRTATWPKPPAPAVPQPSLADAEWRETDREERRRSIGNLQPMPQWNGI